MKITCEKCNALYEVEDSRMPPEGLTMKCPRCLASFTVRPPGSPIAAPAAGARSGPASRYYLRRRTGKVFGPFLERAIASMLEQHKLDGDEDVSLDGQTWQPMVQVPALASFLRGPTGSRTAVPSGASGALSGPPPQAGLDALADLPAPKGSARGGLDALADLPAPKGSLDALGTLPTSRGNLSIADLPAPKSGPTAGPRGFGAGTGDPGEFDLNSPEPAGVGNLPPTSLPSRQRPAPHAAISQVRATGLEYGQIELGPDSEDDLSDLPAPKDAELPSPKSAVDLPMPKRAVDERGPADAPDLLQPKTTQGPPPTPGLGIFDMPSSQPGPFAGVSPTADGMAELDDLPVSAGKSAGVALDVSFELPAGASHQPDLRREAPDLVAPKSPFASGAPIVDVVAPKLPPKPEPEDEPADVVTFAPPPREALQAADAPGLLMDELALPKSEEPAPIRRLPRIKPLWMLAGGGSFLLLVGLLLGLLTDFGFFGINLITGQHRKIERARARLSTAATDMLSDTFQGYSRAADDLESAARVLGDARPWALQAQACGATLHRFGPQPGRRTQMDTALTRLNKLEDKSSETESARALALLSAGQVEPAAAALQKISDREPGNAAASLYLGWALAATNGRQALTAFARALTAQPRMAGAMFGTADVYRLLHDSKNCEIWVDKTLALEPQHTGALLLKARLLLAADKVAEAKPLLDKVIAQQASPPELSMARTLLAERGVTAGQVNEARVLLAEAVRMDPRNAHAHMLIGRLHYDSRQYAEALRLFETARRLDPTDIQAATMLANTYVALGRLTEAQKVVQELAGTAPDAPDVMYSQGLVHETMGNLDLASTSFKNLVNRVPTRFDAYYHLTKINLRQNKPEEALKVLQQAEAKLPGSAQVRAAQGEVLYANHKLDEARTRLEEALRMEPTNNLASFLLASVLVDQGQLEQARAKLLELKQRDKAFPGASAKLGEVYLMLKDPLKASEEYEQALSSETPTAALRLSATRAFLDAGKIDKAIEQCSKAFEADVSSAAASRALMAEARFKQGKLDDALVEIQQAIGREKKAAYFVLLGRIQEARNKNLDALDAYTEAIKQDNSLQEIRLRRAVLMVRGGAVKDGLRELKAVIAGNPGSADAYFYMGVAQKALGQEPQALQSWINALSKDPKHSESHYNIALVYADTQRLPQALTHLEAAVKAGQPGVAWLPDAYFQLGNLQQGRGQKKAAIEAYQQFLKLAPPAAVLRSEAQKRLQQLGAGG